ncbi:hypothetical protein C8F01DRAFT_761070 [Mycena amicta]|nr:hypothetical protein C8F01DRAFT_761070 [Mycena amicta]
MPQASLDLSSMSFVIAPSICHALLLIFFLSIITSFAPGNISRTILTVLISGSPLLAIASRYTLKGRLHALDSVLNATKDLLADAQESCGLGAQTLLLFERTRLQRAEILRSDALCSILELCNCPWGTYPHQVFRLWRTIAICKREAKDIRKTIRVRLPYIQFSIKVIVYCSQEIIEDDNKLKLEREIQNTQQDISNAANLRFRSYPAGSRPLRRFPDHSTPYDA